MSAENRETPATIGAIPGMSNLTGAVNLTGTPTTESTAATQDTGSDKPVEKLAIVGSGPAGWAAAIYAARAGFAPLVLAGELEAGGALMNTTEVENYPGFPEGILGPDLMAKMQEQAERFGARVEYVDVTAAHLDAPVKELTTSDDEVIRARAVILALGSAYRKLGLDGESRLSGKGVSWCATCDGFFFRDKKIAVVGGGDSAITEALFLTKFASSVTVIHRRDELRASQVMIDRAMAEPKINFAWNSVVSDIHGEDALEAVTLTDTQDGSTRRLELDGLFIAIGHDPRSGIVSGEVNVDTDGYIIVEHPTTATNIAGVFACGDVVDHRYRQAITAAGTGAAAALDAEAFLDDDDAPRTAES